jgi:hypothetical protein
VTPAPSLIIPQDVIESLMVSLAKLAGHIAAGIVEERLKRTQHPEYATAKRNPLGSPRQFLDATRDGNFESFKRGREVAARWEDVVRFIESNPPTRRHKNASLEAELHQAATPRRVGKRRG